MDSKESKNGSKKSKKQKEGSLGSKRRVESEETEKVELHSANNWEKVDLGGDDRKNKFLRLMGASKKEHHGRFVIGENQSEHGRTKEETEKLTEGLEEQYQQGIDLYTSGAARCHKGLGFLETNDEDQDRSKNRNEERKPERAKEEEEDKEPKEKKPKIDRDHRSEGGEKEKSKNSEDKTKSKQMLGFVKSNNA